jgi:pumilio RNA-binding family
VLHLSFEPHGTRLVQEAFGVADRQTAAELVQELHGFVRRAIDSPHANYVLQKVIEVMPRVHIRFILDELRGVADATARHRYGCRILCRLLEYAGSDEGVAALLDEVVEEAGALVFHFFGHHVLQHIFEHGTDWQKHRVAMAICDNMENCAQDPHGSFIVEAAVRYCSDDDQFELATCVLGSDPTRLVSLASSRFGSHVVRAVLRMPGATAERATRMLLEHATMLEKTKFGRHVLEEAGKTAAQAGSSD